MRHAFTAVIEQANTYTTDFATEPYETGWASEARWFIRILELEGTGSRLTIEPQISPDGLFWCGEGSTPITIENTGMWSLPLRDFGSWLRLNFTMDGDEISTKVLIYLALKE